MLYFFLFFFTPKQRKVTIRNIRNSQFKKSTHLYSAQTVASKRYSIMKEEGGGGGRGRNAVARDYSDQSIRTHLLRMKSTKSDKREK